jgi:hypothetical protein
VATVTAIEAGQGEDLLERAVVQGVRGHVVCARGSHDGIDSLAIWHVSAEGAACGAWVWPWPSTPEDARRAVSLIDGRLLVDVDPDSAAGVVAQLSETAGIADTGTVLERVQRVTPGWLLDEVASFQASLQKAFDSAVAERAAMKGSKLVPLDFPSMPDRLSGDLKAQLAKLGMTVPASASEVIAHALGTANMVGWLIRMWQDAEGQRMRRAYLRTGFESRPLSTAWLAALRTASRTLLIRP